ncbi:MAG: RidA family protein [Clostridiales Family XIII bacterium]|jgi:2-iminobutanoate/2-iminopropanoate deaminase|nr:RidA family protein [Clostridiales Family XIII bacterium]
MNKEMIASIDAPAAIGPYVQANKAGNLLFVSGQIPLDPVSGEIVGSTIEEQTHRVLQNLEAILKEAGTSFSNVLKTTVFLSDMNHFGGLNATYAEYFQGPELPARSTVQVGRLPKDVLVEIEAIALIV